MLVDINLWSLFSYFIIIIFLNLVLLLLFRFIFGGDIWGGGVLLVNIIVFM